MKAKTTLPLAGVLAVLVALLFGYLTGTPEAVFNPLAPGVRAALARDPRNTGIEMAIFGRSGKLYVDLAKFDTNKAPVDLFRCLAITAETLKNETFSDVILSREKKPVYLLTGSYFKKLGSEYQQENGVYLIRTFPENLMDPTTRQKSFQTWEGGVLGVAKNQLEDFNVFTQRWVTSGR